MSEVVTLDSGSEALATVRSVEGRGLTNIFQLGANVGLVMKMPNKSPEVIDALQQVNQLAREYETLKIDVFLRAERASWLFLSNVYDYVLRINKSIKKRQIKSDLIDMIKQRDRVNISTASETETVVVRYVFSDMARQSRNNYVVVIQKALSMDVEEGELVGLLEQSGGIINWVNKTFEGTEIGKPDLKDQRKTQRADAVSLMRRLLALMASAQGVTPVNTPQVADWTPSPRQLASVKVSNQASPKYQAGDFVFFIATPSNTQNEYNLIQGFSAARDFEDQLLLQIATRLGTNNEQLQAVVSEFEASMLN